MRQIGPFLLPLLTVSSLTARERVIVDDSRKRVPLDWLPSTLFTLPASHEPRAWRQKTTTTKNQVPTVKKNHDYRKTIAGEKGDGGCIVVVLGIGNSIIVTSSFAFTIVCLYNIITHRHTHTHTHNTIQYNTILDKQLKQIQSSVCLPCIIIQLSKGTNHRGVFLFWCCSLAVIVSSLPVQTRT
jgi:hypothetical protein